MKKKKKKERKYFNSVYLCHWGNKSKCYSGSLSLHKIEKMIVFSKMIFHSKYGSTKI